MGHGVWERRATDLDRGHAGRRDERGARLVVTAATATATLTYTPTVGAPTAISLSDATSAKTLADGVNRTPNTPFTAQAGSVAVADGTLTGTLAGGLTGDVKATQAVASLTLEATAPGAEGNRFAASFVPSDGRATPSATDVDFALTMTTAQGPQVIERLTGLDASDMASLAETITTRSSYVVARAMAATTVTPASPAVIANATDTAAATITIGEVVLAAREPDTLTDRWKASVTAAASGTAGLLDLALVDPAGKQSQTLLDLPSDGFSFASAVARQSSVVGLNPFSGGADGTWTLSEFQDAVLTELGVTRNDPNPPIPRLDRIVPQSFNLMCIPDAVWFDPASSDIVTAADAFCLERKAFLLVDPPPPGAVRTIPSSLGTDAPPATAIDRIGDPANLQSLFSTWADHVLDSNHSAGATYYPWVQIPDPAADFRPRHVPPSGTMAGVYARIDDSSGVWTTPAGMTATLQGVIGLADTTIDDEVNGELSQRGINCLRTFPTYGIAAWACGRWPATTCSTRRGSTCRFDDSPTSSNRA